VSLGVITIARISYITCRLTRGGDRIAGIAVSVAVGIAVVRGASFINISVTVIVRPIARLGGAGIGSGVLVVAVIRIGHIPRRRRSSHHGVLSIAVAIAIGVPIVGRAALINICIAVVIHTVAGLRGSWIDTGVGIVAVPCVGHIPRWRRDSDHNILRVAVGIAIGIPIISHATLINVAVTVVILAVARLCCTRIDLRIAVITVASVCNIPGLWVGTGRPGGVSIPVSIHVPIEERTAFIHSPVAVVIHTVTRFRCPGIDTGIRVVTVATVSYVACRWAGSRRGVTRIAKTITVGVPVIGGATLVHRPVTVVIYVITNLRGPGMDTGIAVVTVNVSRIAVVVIVHVCHRTDATHIEMKTSLGPRDDAF
jgi:hypothetical protein